MPTDRKRHLEAGGTSGIPRRILIYEVNNKVWTQGQSKAALQLSSLRRVMWSNCAASGNGIFSPKKMCSHRLLKTYRCYRKDSHLRRINTCIVGSSHIINHPSSMCTQHTPHQTPHHFPPSENNLPIPLQHKCKSQRVASVYQHRYSEQKWYPRSQMSCQMHATRSVRDSRGMNYCPVATVTPRMQKTPCRGLKNGDLWDFILKTIPVTRRGEGGLKERKKIDSEREREKKRLRYSEKKARGRRRETRRCFTRNNLQQCFRQFGLLLSLYFYKASRNTSSAIHFISIPTPASYLHFVSFTPPFHFSACHYISWMITYWQFLHWHSTDQDTTLPASKEGGKWWAFFQSSLSFSFFSPPPQVPVLLSGFHRQPPNLLIKSRSLPSDPYEPLQG